MMYANTIMILKAALYLLTARLACEPSPPLAALFTPAHPIVGRYEACTSPDGIRDAMPADFSSVPIETLEPLDAFGTAGPYDRAALVRLYGGRRANVARASTVVGQEVESWTFISPYPDVTLSRLMPGTLIIRFRLFRGL